MTEHSLHSTHHRFREARERLAAEAEHDDLVCSEGVFATGLLAGGGFPGAAAAVSVLMDQRWPGRPFPWSGAPA